MPLTTHFDYLLPSWDGTLRSAHPEGFLEASGIKIDYATQPSLWHLAADLYKVAKEQGWTKEDAQREFAGILKTARGCVIPTKAAQSAYEREAVTLVRKHGGWAVRMVFGVVCQLYTARHGSAVYNIDNSDRRTLIEQRIELVSCDFAAQDRAEQDRRIKVIVDEAIKEIEAQRASSNKHSTRHGVHKTKP
jgi:hypothetical protein